MRRNDAHISDSDLLLAADAELDAKRSAEVREHLASCVSCLARMHKIQEVSADLTAVYRSTLESSQSHLADSRAALLENLSRQSQSTHRIRWIENFAQAFSLRQFAYNAAIAVLAILVIAAIVRQFWLTNSGGTIAQVQAASLPRPNLTPGAVLSVPSDICLAAPREDASRIPISERKEVFREYGMDYRHASQYELDHLITPALGGTDDIHNLWPEPYNSTEWNAHVKDQLEDLLHQMVCSGQIDLSTAQHDISTNWIGAYKRYFHTDKPLPTYSRLVQDSDDPRPDS
jgi:hypothetical protein